MWDILFINTHLATCIDGYGILENAALASNGCKIVWLGAQTDLTDKPENLAREVIDCQRQWILPGLIDCHTHLVYGGSRADEFEQRLKGVRYEDIAKKGGGIMSTVRATRDADEDSLYHQSLLRLKDLIREGITGLEIKSGYGLDLETERKMLSVATRLRDDFGLPIQRTFLGAHALPPEYKDDKDGYIDHICSVMLPALAKENLIDAVDAFCENIAFSAFQVDKLFKTAQDLSLPVKLHAEQLSDQKGTLVAAKYQALSTDHLEFIDETAVEAMAEAGTTAVLLPGAFYYLRETQLPPVDLFRKHNVPMAIATDHNPGTSPTLSPLLMINMACTLFRLTPEEAISGFTRNASKALGWDNRGTLTTGNASDLSFWQISHPNELAYFFGKNPCKGICMRGHYVAFE